MPKDKDYVHLRLDDFPLYARVKIRAVQEGETAIDLIQKALKEYLKKPIDTK